MSNAVCLKKNGVLELFTISSAELPQQLRLSQCLGHYLDIDAEANLSSLFQALENDSIAREIFSLKGYPKLRHAYLSSLKAGPVTTNKQLTIQLGCCLNLFKDDAGTGNFYSQGNDWYLYITTENYSEPESIYKFSFEELLQAQFNISEILEIYEHDEIGEITGQYKARGAQLDVFGFLTTLMAYLTELPIKETQQTSSS